VPGHSFPDAAFTVLLVCTGNICRSALAERLGRAYLDERLGDDAAAIRLVSAGTQAVVDSAMHPDSALVLRGYGAEAGDFRARQLTESIAGSADLTLTMTRGHRREALRLAPRGLARTFTVREAADLLALVGEEPELDGDGLGERARSLVKAMAEARSRRTSDEGDDVPDPISGPPEAHEEAGELIAAALLPLLARIAALHTGDLGDVSPARQPAGARARATDPEAARIPPGA
jgi:protein-tyrosine-phosphatase